LLPKLFSAVHPKYKTPHYSTWIACFAVGIPAGLVDIGDAADLANIGTLFAFVLVARSNFPASPSTGPQAGLPRAVRAGIPDDLSDSVWRPDVRSDADHLASFCHLVGAGLLIYVFYSRHHSEFCKKDRVAG
jgi:Amino acid transporters